MQAGAHAKGAPQRLSKGRFVLTTTDGLWVLQVLTGIEVLAPESGYDRFCPASRRRRWRWRTRSLPSCEMPA